MDSLTQRCLIPGKVIGSSINSMQIISDRHSVFAKYVKDRRIQVLPLKPTMKNDTVPVERIIIDVSLFIKNRKI